jgi:hypothetical protein
VRETIMQDEPAGHNQRERLFHLVLFGLVVAYATSATHLGGGVGRAKLNL